MKTKQRTADEIKQELDHLIVVHRYSRLKDPAAVYLGIYALAEVVHLQHSGLTINADTFDYDYLGIPVGVLRNDEWHIGVAIR